jgi:hypothetical protein
MKFLHTDIFSEMLLHDSILVRVCAYTQGMTTTHTTTVVPAEPTTWHGNESYTIICTCGERVSYRGREFTEIEAMRHRAYHHKKGN